MIVNSTLSIRNSFVADRIKKDLELENPIEYDDTLSWVVKEASNLMETMWVEEEPIQKTSEQVTTEPAPMPRASNAFDGLEMAAVLQEAILFHDDVAVKHDPQAALLVLAKLLRLKDMDSTRFTKSQATDLFFATTKLFVCQDECLRRFVYLFLKEIYTFCDPNDVIIVTSSLMKDVTCDVDICRTNSLRVLARIIDPAMLTTVERFVKQAIVDNHAPLVSAGLLAGVQLSQKSSESAAIIRRWITETHQAIQKHKGMVQYHAILLLYQMKKTDRLAISKIVSQYSKKGLLSNPMALLMIIRYTTKLLMDESEDFVGIRLQDVSPVCQEGYDFLVTCLRLKSEMVVYEAARALSLLPITDGDLYPVVGTLHGFLMSPKPCVRLGALRALSTVTERFPGIVTRCNEELEKLCEDENPTIATLALTTLLKTCNEHMLVNLLGRVAALLGSMENEYRISIVQSILLLCISYPRKHEMLVGLLGSFLMTKGSFQFKQAIVKGIEECMQASPETIEASLLILSKSLDACEHVNLTTEVLYIVAEMGPYVQDASQHVPYISNCFLLGGRPIRAAAVSALAKFASHHRTLRRPLTMLLRRCQIDEDEETRDRAAAAVTILSQSMEEGEDDGLAEEGETRPDPRVPDSDIPAHIYSALPMSFTQLEHALQKVASTPELMNDTGTLCFDSLPVVAVDLQESQTTQSMSLLSKSRLRPQDPAADVYKIPELASLGRSLKSSKPIPLTEREAEYVVHCIKHLYDDYVVLQFKIQNTVEESRLEGVSVAIGSRDEEELYEATGELPASGIGYGQTGSCFVVLMRDRDKPLSSATFACELQFTVCPIDGESGEEIGECYEEEYPLEDVEILPSDFVLTYSVQDFRGSWDSVGKENELFKKVGLQITSLEEAVKTVVGFLGMDACDSTANVRKGATKQTLHLCGSFLGSTLVMARVQLAPHNGIIVLKIMIRSSESKVSQTVLDWIC